jgi:hypothetical protein
MQREYKTFTELYLKHDYYKSGYCGDFIVAASVETADFLKRNRMIFGSGLRTNSSHFQTLREFVGQSAVIPLPSTYRLRFTLTLKNAALLNFTNFGEDKKGPNDIYLFRNSTNGAVNQVWALDRTKATVTGDFLQLEGLDELTTSITATPESFIAGEPFNIAVLEENDDYKARINFEKKPKGRYLLSGDGPFVSQYVYYDPTLVGKGLFGLVELTVNESFAINSTGYAVDLHAKTAFWKYFVVFKGSHTNFTYAINSGLNFESYDDEAEDWSAYDEKTLGLLTSLNALPSQIKAWRSQDPLQYQEVARSFITLKRTDSNDVTVDVVTNLPNPTAGAPEAVVIVGVDPPV